MANARPPGGATSGGPQARIGIDLSSMQAAAGVARAAGQATAREINAMFQSVRTSQQLAIQQARQATSTINAQNAQVTANARAQATVQQQAARATAQVQIQQARAAAQVQIQQARAAAQVQIQQARAVANAQRQASSGQGFSQFAGAALGGIGGPLGGVLGGVAGGTPAIAAGLAASAGARAAIEASQVAVAYDRQRVAAVNLAGSQARLNDLLGVYDQATGGAISNAEALANVTKLMSVGFADNAQELDQFARAIRGISIAMGTNQDTVTQNLVLELFSQRGMRLDQLGLQYDKVRQRADELRAADASLTQQQAYQNAVLEQAEERFGALADSAEGGATGIEKVAKAWRDLQLEIGQQSEQGVNETANWFAGILDYTAQILRDLKEIEQRKRQISGGTINLPGGFIAPAGGQVPLLPSAANQSGNLPFTPYLKPGVNTFDPDQTAALRRRDEGFADIEREYRLARQDEIQSYNQQVASTERNYQKQRAREAEDFARQRLNAERKLGLSILDVAQDSARQRVKWEQDTARQIAELRAETSERIAELRADAVEKVAEIEEDFAQDQEKRARDHGKRLRDAVANLDAVALREEQRRFREENQEAKDAHEERIADAEESLQKAIDDQQKALAKQEAQQTESLARRIAEQADNDRLRIQEMKAAFEAQKIQEDEERAIRLGRQEQDHNDQLIELARQHADRIQQIKDHAQEERDQFTEESNAFLEKVGIHNQAWLDEQEAINDGVIKRHQELLDAERRALLLRGQPPVDHAFPGLYAAPGAPSTPITPAASANSVNSTRTSTVNIQPGAITIVPPPNANYSLDERFAAYIHGVLADFFEDYPQ